jgi:hypothetical protein
MSSAIFRRKRLPGASVRLRLETLEERCVPTISFQFSSSVYQVANTQQGATITVTMDNPDGTLPDGPLDVDYAASPSVVSQPSARPGTDFIPTNGTLQFSSSTPTQTFTVTILDGTRGGTFIEPVYFVDLNLSNPTSGSVLGTPSQALLRITTAAPSMLTLTPLPLRAAQNVLLTTQIIEFSDSTQDLQADSYKAVVSWGDGTPAVTAPVQPQGNFFTVNGSHVFSQEGTFTYTVTVIPGNGPSATTTGTVVVGGFVTGLYNDLFDRAPDAGGLQFWDATIANGASRQQVAFIFWNSPEHQATIVQQFYQSFLGRPADAAGLVYWTNVLTSGTSGAQVAAAFSTSPEFLAAHPTNNQFLLADYVAIEGSAPAANNVLFQQIIVAFNAGIIDRPTVTLTILGLPETYTNAVDDYFTSFLDRSPDLAGRAFYTAEMLSGNFSPAVIGSQILGSVEYLVLQDAKAIG